MDAPLKAMLSNRYFFGKGIKASDEYEQFWIRYKPTRVLRKRLQAYTKRPDLLYAAVAMVFLAVLVMFGSAFCLAAIVLSAVCFIVYRAGNLLAPTHIALSEDGLQVHWLRNFCNISGPLIGWDRLSHLSIAKINSGFGTTDNALEFNLIANGIPLSQRFKYAVLAPHMASGWLRGNRCALRIKLDAIASSDDRKRLQMALKKFLPSYRIDATVTDELNLALRVESYTDLWLDALSSSKRIREDMLEPGTHILAGKYEIVKHIGGGGQAVVYEAIEKVSAGHGAVNQRKVVLKEFVLPAQAGVNVRKRVLGNIQREAQMLKKLEYENIVRFIDFFVDDQRAYVVLEHIDGVTLKQYIEAGGVLTEQETVKLSLQMAKILKNLHTSSPPVIHRDFTPDNLMIDQNKNLKLIDFNVAEHLEATNSNTVVGKHAFIPPEQFRGKATVQSDIYAMGATMYFLLTTEEPEAISVSVPQSLNSLISDELNAVVIKATEQDVACRFSCWSEIEAALETIARNRY
jgi:predicted Ser/Thr protein kinase